MDIVFSDRFVKESVLCGDVYFVDVALMGVKGMTWLDVVCTDVFL